MKKQKYIIEIKLKKEKYSRYYYDVKQSHFGIEQDEFWMMIDDKQGFLSFYFKNIDYFRIIEQGE